MVTRDKKRLESQKIEGCFFSKFEEKDTDFDMAISEGKLKKFTDFAFSYQKL